VKIIIEGVLTIRSYNFVLVTINFFNAKKISLHTEYENPSFADALERICTLVSLFDKCWQVVTILVEH
jgi:hypothetical protein